MALPSQPLVARKRLIGVVEEATAGTGQAVTAAAAIIVYDLKCEPVAFTDAGERMPDGHYMGEIAAVVGPRIGRMTFRQEVRHNDGFLTLLLIAAGYVLDTGTYVPSSDLSNHKTLTMKAWVDGIEKELNGCMGTCRIVGENGGRVFAEWEFTGVWVAPHAQAMPALAPVTAVTKFLSAATAFTIAGAEAPQISTFSIDLGNTIEMRPSLVAAAGAIHAQIVERNPTVELDFEAHLIADFDPFASLLAGTLVALSLALNDGTNTLTVAAPKMQYKEVGDEARQGRATTPATFRCAASSGDDELTFTQA